MTEDRNRSEDPRPGGEDSDASDDPKDGAAGDRHHSIEDEIEEILREKGEAPGRAYRPSPRRYPSLPPMPPAIGQTAQGFLILALGAVLLFLAFRIMGPAGFRFGGMGLLLFLAFYAIRPIIQEFLRRRSR